MREPPPALDIALGWKASLGLPKPPHMRNPRRAKELAEAMVAFGGFSDAASNTTGKRTRMQTVLSQWARAVDRTPKEENLQEQVAKSPTGGANPLPATEEIPWSPFTQADETSTSDAGSLEPPASSLPPQSEKHSPCKPVPKPNAPPEAPSTPQHATPRLSKKQRLLFAVRSAAASQPSADDDIQGPTETPSLGDGTSADRYHPGGTEVQSMPSNAATHNEGNKQAARKWWNIFMGEKA